MNNVLTNIRLVKTCIAEEKEEERGKILTKELFNIGIKGGKITALVQPLTTMLIFLLLILIGLNNMMEMCSSVVTPRLQLLYKQPV